MSFLLALITACAVASSNGFGQGSAFGGLDEEKIMFGGQNAPKTKFFGAGIGILSQMLKNFKWPYLHISESTKAIDVKF